MPCAQLRTTRRCATASRDTRAMPMSAVKLSTTAVKDLVARERSAVIVAAHSDAIVHVVLLVIRMEMVAELLWSVPGMMIVQRMPSVVWSRVCPSARTCARMYAVARTPSADQRVTLHNASATADTMETPMR